MHESSVVLRELPLYYTAVTVSVTTHLKNGVAHQQVPVPSASVKLGSEFPFPNSAHHYQQGPVPSASDKLGSEFPFSNCGSHYQQVPVPSASDKPGSEFTFLCDKKLIVVIVCLRPQIRGWSWNKHSIIIYARLITGQFGTVNHVDAVDEQHVLVVLVH